MRFYDRETELEMLDGIMQRASEMGQMTVLVGRRRIGKTRLIQKSLENDKFLYFFVAKKDEKLLCNEFLEDVKETLDIRPFGTVENFKSLFEFLLDASTRTSFSLVIDEFQEFYKINPSVYSDMQNLWDQYKDKSRMNLILCGSIYSLMTKIFENNKEPLFGRANDIIRLKPFKTNVIKRIFSDNSKTGKNKDLLALYILTGGVAKYLEYYVDKDALSFNKMKNTLLSENSLLLNEGKSILIEEFGKDYTTYFSILSLIAFSKTSRAEIESILERNVGGYIDRLENEYSIIKKHKPVFSRATSRIQKYYIEDNFLNFWFRFIFKYRSAVEIGNFNYLRNIVERDFDTFSGPFLEKYFRQKFAESGEFSIVGNYWEKGNKNEIDLVAVDEYDKKAIIAEVKLNKEKINLQRLEEKSTKLLQNLRGYKIEYKALSVEDM